ncbi:hypothetical protein NDU88_003123 [Pleurodeles waltl]|uniref:Uncharacterized protein n=1 Tax=Pleurodeles waltl TaxID=8319 RepID=A0AAV7SF97_PLEWA|nr:hypothetical protein NDU88_003123 [Pleurodeles waltl]
MLVRVLTSSSNWKSLNIMHRKRLNEGDYEPINRWLRHTAQNIAPDLRGCRTFLFCPEEDLRRNPGTKTCGIRALYKWYSFMVIVQLFTWESDEKNDVRKRVP